MTLHSIRFLRRAMTNNGKNLVAANGFKNILRLKNGRQYLHDLYEGSYIGGQKGPSYDTPAKLATLWDSVEHNLGRLTYEMGWDLEYKYE